MSSGARLTLPRVYGILDAEVLERLGMDAVAVAVELQESGVRLLQYRDKRGDRLEVARVCRRLVGALGGSGCRLILNDYAELVVETGFDGVHVGQGDLEAVAARAVIGDGKMLGVSTHTEAQVRAAESGPADYVAVGPVFRTGTKLDAAEVVGTEGVRRARALTGKPLVAIGGIGVERVGEVLAAGADAVAVIGALYRPGLRVGESARELLRAAGE